MASTIYMLRDGKAQNETRIICLLTDGRKVRIKIYTDYSVHPENWSDTLKKVKSKDPNQIQKNIYLNGKDAYVCWTSSSSLASS